MERWLHPTNSIEERDRATPLPSAAASVRDIDPQWAPQALRDAAVSFGEDGNWGIVPAQDTERREGEQ
ncbi:MAG: hypothetical protein LC793_14260 [Thermomicrobia bacterium]|nr:hypothetical protein [Thermomicrobia bacterium]